MLQLIWIAGEFCGLGLNHSRESKAFHVVLINEAAIFFGDYPYLESTTVLSDTDISTVLLLTITVAAQNQK